jgi:hypothetical protein
MACGNIEEFERTAVYNVRKCIEERVDGKTEESIDEIDTDEDEEFDDYEDLKCAECESYEVEEDLGEEEILEIQVEHTDKGGKWHPGGIEKGQENAELNTKLMGIRL